MPTASFEHPDPPRNRESAPREPARERIKSRGSLRGICQDFVQKVSDLKDVDYTALWVKEGFLHHGTGHGYELVKSVPEGRTARLISESHELSEWAKSAGNFGWMACDEPPAGVLSRKGSTGVFILFAQERHLILALNICTDEPEIEGLQFSLAELSAQLSSHMDPAAIEGEIPEIVVDLGFLQAMAMGDDTFVRHMLDLCIEQLAVGSEGLYSALDQDSPQEVVHLAHKLRSTARTAGVEALDQLLAQVETEAEQGNLGRVRVGIRACEQTISAINQLL
jgi:HPt (histidine-containing phosphotransfer) domain-containing protein